MLFSGDIFCVPVYLLFMASKSHHSDNINTSFKSCAMPKGIEDALALSSNVLPTLPVAGESVDKRINLAPETFNIDKGDHTVDHAKAS